MLQTGQLCALGSVALWTVLLPGAATGQAVDTTRFKLHEKNALGAAVGVMEAHPDWYAHVCVNERKSRVVRFSDKLLRAPNGKHPDKEPIMPDLEVDLYGLTMSPAVFAILQTKVTAHNKAILNPPPKESAETKQQRASDAEEAHRRRMQEYELNTEKYKAASKYEPPVRNPSGTREQYFNVAALLSFDHRQQAKAVAPAPTAEQLAAWKNANSPQIQHVAELLLLGKQEEEKLRGSVARKADEAERRAEETRAAAAAGAFTRKEVYYDYDDRGNLRKTEYDVDESFWPMLLSGMAASIAGNVSPEFELIQRKVMLDGARSRSWDELLPEMAAQHAGPVTQRTLVQIDYLNDGPGGQPLKTLQKPELPTAPGAGESFQGRYLAKNLAPRDLHNVTLAIDLYHYSTLPAVTLRHCYFLPLWKTDESIELSRSFLIDLKRGGKHYRAEAMEASGGPTPDVHPDLHGLAGVVQMQTTLWSDEARQEPKPQIIAARAQAVSRVLIKYAEQTAAGQWAVTPENVRAPATPKKGEQPANARPSAEMSTEMQIAQLLNPVKKIMPADSSEMKQVGKLLTDFKAVRTEVLEKRVDDLLDACAEGQHYVGLWTTPGIMPGDLGLLFISCTPDGKRIRAELYNPKEPQQRRLVAGFIAKDQRSAQQMVMLEPLEKDKGVEAMEVEDFNILHKNLKSYRFQLKDGELIGQASNQELPMAAFDGRYRPISLKAAARDERVLADAKVRNQAAPQGPPREPFSDRPIAPRGLQPGGLPPARGIPNVPANPRGQANPRTPMGRPR
jgi:hypothetical protein